MWTYQGNEFAEIPEGYAAFVYLITNKKTNKKYIGKKLFYFSRSKTVKGKKKRTKVESDWKDYWSSSEENPDQWYNGQIQVRVHRTHVKK